jgi:hypothetical protein
VDNRNPLTQNTEDSNYYSLWKIRQIFDIPSSKFSELYQPTEHMAVEEVIIKFKGEVVFWQYSPETHKEI